MKIYIKSLAVLPLLFVLTLCLSSLNAHPHPNDPSLLVDGEPTIVDAIIEKGRLDVIILNSPTTYYAGAEKELGFEYELISSFAKDLGVDINLTVVFTVSEALEKSRQGVGDITVAGLTVTPDREKEFKFGPQYHTVQEQLICNSAMYKAKTFPRDLEDLAGLKIIVGKDTSYETTLNEIKEGVEDFDFTTTIEESTEQLLDATYKREIDCTVADSSVFMINQRYYPKLVRALVLSSRKNLAWIIRDGDDSLNDALYKWLNTYERSGKMAELRDFYYSFLSIFDYYDTSIFYERLEKRLPKYKHHFKKAGKKYNIPWMFLAAQSYQESHWNPQATSYTGVRGMMMLTNNTAKLLGVKNRIDVRQSIFGGAKYLRVIEKKLAPEIKGNNRWAFALASYNVGLGHIYDAQTLARKLNKNPYAWRDIKEVLPLLTQKKYYRKLKYGYARGNEPVKYVDAIQNYYDIIQKNEAKLEHVRLVKEKVRLKKEEERAARIASGKVIEGLKIIPKTKIWVGYINIDTKKKYQKVAKDVLVIDTNKNWLLLVGGGTLNIEVNEEFKTFKSKNNMRFKYVSGEFSKIDIEEFKRLNNGKKW
ncbi:MAG: membrane-bound lytic murein transglycosylase MltF [Sulfurimonas sp.]|nr:membrane-bound lytic murein transglycosylase MltF [Sulfurimonas sp.]